MAFNINRVTLVGRLGNDAEMRTFQNGGAVVNFRVATSETWKDRQGQKQERTEWSTIAVFAKWLIDDAQKLRKGDMVSIEGKLQTRKWQDSGGNDRYATEVVLTGMDHSLFKIAPRDRSGGQQGGGRQDDGWAGGQQGGQSTGGSFGGSGGSGGGWDDLDDDVPF